VSDGHKIESDSDDATPPQEQLSESAKRRKRTDGYLKLWNIVADLSPIPVRVASSAHIANAEAIVGRAKALCLVSLKGQGLSQYETFAFADGYEVWDHLTLAEHDFVLDDAPSDVALLQYAWRYEGMLVLLWALGLSKHLGFPTEPYEPGKALEKCMTGVLAPTSGKHAPLERRSDKEILDAADIAAALHAIALASPASAATPGGLHRGVAFERHEAFMWLTSRP
jgi:hypothetical protein